MGPNLSLLEIAEGALIADLAVIFHLLGVYLPIGGGFFRVLIPVAFAVVILRRRLYLGLMVFFVTFFTASVVTGLVASIPILHESGAGLFLGVTMKHRLRHFPLLLLGVTSSAIALGIFILLVTLLLGLSFSDIVQSMQKSYEAAVSTLGFIALKVGLGDWWKHSGNSFFKSIAHLVFTYWLDFFFIALWFSLWPIALIYYFITNLLVRLLGYDVRPFPGGRIEKDVRRLKRVLLRAGLKRRIFKRRSNKA